MTHKNQDKQFLKIPYNWVSKDPKKLQSDIRPLYGAYLYVKNFSRFGRIHYSNLPKQEIGYWITKLISTGIMKRDGDYYTIIGYQQIWKLLGFSKANINGKQRYRFYKKIVDKNLKWKEFKKQVILDIQECQVERKLAQFRRRLKKGDMSKDVNSYRPLFSSQSAAKLLGYKSRTTGNKYRAKFFDVVPEPLFLRRLETTDFHPYFKFACKRIEIKKIYH